MTKDIIRQALMETTSNMVYRAIDAGINFENIYYIIIGDYPHDSASTNVQCLSIYLTTESLDALMAHQ